MPKTAYWRDSSNTVDVDAGYDRDLVDAFKRLRGRWDPDRRVWRFQRDRFAELAAVLDGHGYDMRKGKRPKPRRRGNTATVVEAYGDLWVTCPFDEDLTGVFRGLHGEWDAARKAWKIASAMRDDLRWLLHEKGYRVEFASRPRRHKTQGRR